MGRPRQECPAQHRTRLSSYCNSGGLPREICAHSFRGTGITQIYNRLPEEISFDEIERIHI